MDITTLIRFGKILPGHKARLIMGEPGIGKSSVIRMIAENDNADFLVLPLNQYEPQDFVGLPYLETTDSGSKVTKFAQPWWWPEDSSRHLHLLLDEIDRCSDDMHPLAMQLTLDRSVGGRRLHDNVTIWAACNGEEFIRIPMDQALMDRFAVVNLTPSVSEWLDWATNAGVNRLVVDFIKCNQDHLDTPKNLIGKPDTVAPSRRSWADVGFMVNNLDDPPNNPDLGAFVSAFVGTEASAAFSAWARDNYEPISADLIFAGTVSSLKYNLIQLSFAAEQVAEAFLDKASEQQHNALCFFKDAGHEAFASLFEALPDEAAAIVSKFTDIHEYIVSTKKKIINAADL